MEGLRAVRWLVLEGVCYVFSCPSNSELVFILGYNIALDSDTQGNQCTQMGFYFTN